MSGQLRRIDEYQKMGRGLRFGAVSAINVPLVQLLILLLQTLAGLEGWLANFVAVVVLTGPVYLASKRWVWGRTSAVGIAPVALFWLLSIGGLVASTAAVYGLSFVLDGLWVANAVNLATYGTIFVIRFVVLDHLLRHDAHDRKEIGSRQMPN